MSFTRLSLLAAAFALSGCVTAPKPLQGDYAASAPNTGASDAQKVRWGGDIIRVETGAERTCFEVLARQLDSGARPLRRDRGDGRFLACRAGFYDPAIFTAGREITVTGTVNGSESRKVGDYDYRYPRVDADVIYLWSEGRRMVQVDPWFYGWGPFGYRPFAPPVVVIHSHRHRSDR